ncbi:MAG: hypothetical protein AAB497_00245 [Patescibacteria group bacterium]
MHPILFPVILVFVGLFLLFSQNVSLGFSMVLRRPNIFYAGFGVILLGIILWFVLDYIESTKNGHLMWTMPIVYIIAIFSMFGLSVKETTQETVSSSKKSENFSKLILFIFILFPFLAFAIVFTLVTPSFMTISLTVLFILIVAKFMKNRKI